MLRALVTITAGTAAMPVNIPPGETFDPKKVGLDAGETRRLIDTDSAAEIGETTAAPPRTPVEIPAGWAELSAADMIALALELGAGDAVKAKDGNAAADFVAKVVAERAAAGQ